MNTKNKNISTEKNKKSTNKAATKPVSRKATETEPEVEITVLVNGDKFTVTEKGVGANIGYFKQYESDINPLEEETE